MELLQKLTLYDLLGYTVPGVLFLWLWDWGDILQKLVRSGDGQSSNWILAVIAGYIIGIAFTAAGDLLVWILGKLGMRKNTCKGFSKTYGLSKNDIVQALNNAGVNNVDSSKKADRLLYKYRSYMYSDIQADEKYSRLHNYASAELLCKNMTFVSLLLMMRLNQADCVKVLLGIVVTVLFAIRWAQCSERKSGYAACWFVQKYTHKP